MFWSYLYKRPTGFAAPPHLAKLPQGTHPHANQVGQVLGYCGSQSNTLIFKLSSSKPGFLLTLNSSKAGFLLGKRPTGFANPHLLLFCPKAFNPKLQRSMQLSSPIWLLSIVHGLLLTCLVNPLENVHLQILSGYNILILLGCLYFWIQPSCQRSQLKVLVLQNEGYSTGWDGDLCTADCRLWGLSPRILSEEKCTTTASRSRHRKKSPASLSATILEPLRGWSRSCLLWQSGDHKCTF